MTVKTTQAATVRSYWDMACPKCGKDDNLVVTVSTEVRLLPDGTEDVGADIEWDECSVVLCGDCRFLGEASVFTISAQAAR